MSSAKCTKLRKSFVRHPFGIPSGEGEEGMVFYHWTARNNTEASIDKKKMYKAIDSSVLYLWNLERRLSLPAQRVWVLKLFAVGRRRTVLFWKPTASNPRLNSSRPKWWSTCVRSMISTSNQWWQISWTKITNPLPIHFILLYPTANPHKPTTLCGFVVPLYRLLKKCTSYAVFIISPSLRRAC